jgi:hypothetical protein
MVFVSSVNDNATLTYTDVGSHWLAELMEATAQSSVF